MIANIRLSSEDSCGSSFSNLYSLLLDVGTQLEDVLLAGCLEFVGETKVFNLNLETVERRGDESPRLTLKRPQNEVV